MNKDALLATLIGFGIGLLITGLLLVGPNILKAFPQVKLPSFSFSQKQTAPSPTPPAGELTITIDSPLADAIENNTTMLVSGTTRPGATVVVAGPVDETVVVADSEGKYAGKLTLTEGKNDLVITAYEKTKQATATVTVFYTPVEI